MTGETKEIDWTPHIPSHYAPSAWAAELRRCGDASEAEGHLLTAAAYREEAERIVESGSGVRLGHSAAKPDGVRPGPGHAPG